MILYGAALPPGALRVAEAETAPVVVVPAAAAAELLAARRAGVDVGVAVGAATQDANETFGFTLPSNASPWDENPATWPSVSFASCETAPTATPTSTPARRAARSSVAAAAGTTTTGAVSASATRSAPGGSASP